jgi:hypothetical protein
MNRNITHVNVAADAKIALEFWEQHPDIKLKDATSPQLKKSQAAFESLADECMRKETELRQLMTERDRFSREVQSITRRLRTAVRGIFGPDSSEYEKLGGTRSSLHKVRRRKPATGEAAEAVVAGNGSGILVSNGNGIASVTR